MQLKLSPAHPKDISLMAPLIYDSGSEAFDYVFNAKGKTALQFLHYSLQHKQGEFGYGCHCCVWQHDELVAVGAQFSGSDSLTFLWHNAQQIFSFYPFPASLGVIRRGLQVERILVPPGKAVHYIAHLDTAPLFRSKGIGEWMINQFIDNGKNLLRKSIELDVADTNPRAEQLYKKMGFYTLHKKTSRLQRNGVRVPSYFRMRL